MTKRDYENVGRVLAGIPTDHGYRLNAVVSACQLFSATNPKFDRVKFAISSGLEACKFKGCARIFDDPEELEDHLVIIHKIKEEEVNQWL